MGTIKTAEINPNIVDFLEEKRTTPEAFRSLWQVSEWENKLTVKRSDCTPKEFIDTLRKTFRLSVVPELSFDTDRFNTYCLYSRFVLGKDLLLNVSTERESDRLVAHIKLRSQNMGVVVMIGKRIRRLGE